MVQFNTVSCLVAAATATLAAAGPTILILGDNMGEFSCGKKSTQVYDQYTAKGQRYTGANRIETVCAGSKVTNLAISGSTAWQWGKGSTYKPYIPGKTTATDLGFTHIWLSVGLNDWLTPGEDKDTDAPGADAKGCQLSLEQITARIQSAVDATRAAAVKADIPDVKIILTSYCIPATNDASKNECKIGVNGLDYDILTKAYTNIAKQDNIAFVNIAQRCGGLSGPPGRGKIGDPQYFLAGGRQLNERGYCRAFTYDYLQHALNCDESKYYNPDAIGTQAEINQVCAAVGTAGCEGVSAGVRGNVAMGAFFAAILGAAATLLL
jgi:hypothetical protein